MIEQLDSVAAELECLANRRMFFGAAVLELYLDEDLIDPAEVRPSEDVDVVVDVAVPGQPGETPERLEATLRTNGFTHDTRPHRRNIHAFLSPSGVPVDVVMDSLCEPTDWALLARDHTLEVGLPSGRRIRIPTPPYYAACKVSASLNEKRWEGTYYCHELEDIALLLAGCAQFLNSVRVADSAVVGYLASWADEVLKQESTYGRDAYAVLMSNLPGAASQEFLDGLLRALADRS